MKVKQLIKQLSKIDPEMKIIIYDIDNRGFTDKIDFKEYVHDGVDYECWHPSHKSESMVREGTYLVIQYGDD